MDGASGTWLAADRASDAPAVRPPALTGSRPDRLTAVSCVSSCGDVERQSAGRLRNFSTRAHAKSPLGCWNGSDTLTKTHGFYQEEYSQTCIEWPGIESGRRQSERREQELLDERGSQLLRWCDSCTIAAVTATRRTRAAALSRGWVTARAEWQLSLAAHSGQL
jgi:hypothetical protein